MPYATTAPLPPDLKVALARSSAPRNGWAAKDPYASARTTWKATLENDQGAEGPFYWTGAADGKATKPTPSEVLGSLALDASSYLENPDLESFVAAFGYPMATREGWAEAQRIFNACREVSEAFERLGLDPSAPCFQEA